jgi:hypothetical protein
MKMTRRGTLLTAAAAGFSTLTLGRSASAQQPVPGKLTEEQLGQIIATLGVTPDKQEQRYDFAFRAKMGQDEASEWELSMSSVLSRDGNSIWVMAWLDELPTSAADVPRTALLRLLAENDKLGNGKFFAYIPANRRFVLQKVVANENMTSARFKAILQDVGLSVVQSYGVWHVANWTEGANGETSNTAAAPAINPQPGARSAESESEFRQPIRR